MRNLNSVVVSGRLAAVPELRQTPSGTAVCNFRIACNDSVKNAQTGEYEDRPNWFSVDTFSGLAETCAKYLERGQAVTISGRLRWRSWETDDGQKRSAVSIVADLVEFGAKVGAHKGDAFEQAKGIAAEAQAAPASDSGEDDDLPFLCSAQTISFALRRSCLTLRSSAMLKAAVSHGNLASLTLTAFAT